jgi:predicted O-linked N-acetylglucosamine transferase (SPINDLY family)
MSMRGLMILLLLFLSGWLLESASTDRDSFLVQGASREALRAGRQLLQQNRWNEGVQKAKEALELYPGNREAASILVEVGLSLRDAGQESLALDLFALAANGGKNETTEAMFQAGLSNVRMGRVEVAGEWYRAVLEKDPRHSSARINIAALHHAYGSIEMALDNYILGLKGMGSSLYRWYQQPPQKNMEKSEVMLRSNIGAAYIQLGMFNEANSHISNLIFDLLKVGEGTCFSDETGRSMLLSLGKSRLQDKMHDSVFEEVEREEAIRRNNRSSSEPISTGIDAMDCQRINQDISFAATHLLHIRKATCLWRQREEVEHFLLKTTLDFIALPSGPADAKSIVLLPFDTLLLPMASMRDRLEIATAYSTGPNSPVGAYSAETPDLTAGTAREGLPGRPLRLGLISYDFNDHPTTHLVEALFDSVHASRHQQQRVELYVYSYGRDDNSTYRHRIQELATRFEDVALLAYEETAALIRRQGVDVLYDMQVHTLGNRLKALSFRPAPVQVNYLVYPGTSGTLFLDYLVTDRVVVPAEHARWYSEALMVLPPSYQMSYYTRHASSVLAQQFDQLGARDGRFDPAVMAQVKATLRAKYDLPSSDPSLVVFCNFNKIDKFDRLSFDVWLTILRRVPNSILWLLQPSGPKQSSSDSGEEDSQQTMLTVVNLRAAAAGAGLDPGRIYLAPRVSKGEHLERQLAADLFLDTFTYGAHSTATDALRAAVPVLTVSGGSFPSRVGLSLYESLCASTDGDANSDTCVYRTLIRDSVADFEDSAVAFAQCPASLHQLQHRLAAEAVRSQALFNHQRSSVEFLRGAAVLMEVEKRRGDWPARTRGEDGSSRKPHVVIGR